MENKAYLSQGTQVEGVSLIECTPDSATSATELLKQAVDLLRKEENEKAIPLLRKACLLDPTNAQLHAFLGAALAEELQIDEAESELDQALKLNGQDAFIQLKAGEFMLLLGRTPEALQHLEKAYKLPAPSPETRIYIVNLLKQTRHNSKKIVPRENNLVGGKLITSIKTFFTQPKKNIVKSTPLPEQYRGEI